jgi:hypothetical protein
MKIVDSGFNTAERWQIIGALLAVVALAAVKFWVAG